MDNNVKCPKCGEAIAISEVLAHQIEEQIHKQVQADHKKQLEQTRLEAEAKLTQKIQEQYARQLNNAKEDLEEKDAKNKQLLDQLTELTKALRQTRQEKDEAKLEMEKQLAQEEEKIRTDATQKAEEQQHLKLLEYQKQIQDGNKVIEELKRKMQQGSQQMQGEVLELELEEQLRQEFPNDQIMPVSKGIRGGDVIQEVWDAKGNCNGKILWELKRTKAFSPGWIIKLKQDQRAAHAETAVLVSDILPDGVKISGFKSGIWLTERKFAICIANALRANLIQLYYARQAADGKNEKMDVLYSYFSGPEFKHRVEGIIEAFSSMQDEIEKEKRYFAQKWAKDEKYIRNVIDNTLGMHGDLKAIVGGALPQIKGLQSDDSELTIDGNG